MVGMDLPEDNCVMSIPYRGILDKHGGMPNRICLIAKLRHMASVQHSALCHTIA